MDKASECRMYEAETPQIDELVMVRINNVAEIGAYVSLLEYNNIEGMIPSSAASRRRYTSIKRLFRTGDVEVARVVRVDEIKGYIDLCKKSVSAEDRTECTNKYYMSKMVHGMIREISNVSGQTMLSLYQLFGWDLYKRFDHAYNGFKNLQKKPDSVLAPYHFAPELQKQITDIVKKRILVTKSIVRAEIDLRCFYHPDGIEAIKCALNAGKQQGTDQIKLQIKLKSTPIFFLITECINVKEGIQVMQAAIEAIKKSISEKKGECVVVDSPRVLSKQDIEGQKKEFKSMEKDGDNVNELSGIYE